MNLLWVLTAFVLLTFAETIESSRVARSPKGYPSFLRGWVHNPWRNRKKEETTTTATTPEPTTTTPEPTTTTTPATTTTTPVPPKPWRELLKLLKKYLKRQTTTTTTTPEPTTTTPEPTTTTPEPRKP
ncbi:unnamed protein product [Calicophoron daubneyi]